MKLQSLCATDFFLLAVCMLANPYQFGVKWPTTLLFGIFGTLGLRLSLVLCLNYFLFYFVSTMLVGCLPVKREISKVFHKWFPKLLFCCNCIVSTWEKLVFFIRTLDVINTVFLKRTVHFAFVVFIFPKMNYGSGY